MESLASPYRPLTKDQAILILKSVSTECGELLSMIEKRKGWLAFPSPDMTDAIRNLRVHNYPLLYESEQLLASVQIQGLFSPEGFQSLVADFDATEGQERTELLEAIIFVVSETMDAIHWPRTLEEKRAAQAAFDALPPEKQKEATKQAQYFVASTMASFHQTLSVMVHSERLTSLVARAKNGDADAFMKAVQIDTRILEEVPYFRERHHRALDGGESEFLRRLGAVRSRPPYRGRIQHKAVYWGFSILQDLKLLEELKHREILDVFDKSGMNLAANRIEDVPYLTKRLGEFKRLQKTGVVSMS